MNWYKPYWIFLAATLFAFGCKGPQDIIKTPDPVEERDLDEIVVVPEVEPSEAVPLELPVYNPSFTRANDLLHTKLDLSFDWEKQHVLGEAWIDAKPLFYPTDMLELDAKGFDILDVKVDNKSARYEYGEDVLKINLGKPYTADQPYQVYIKYVAKPNEREFGGSSAITSEKGLFFINPTGKEGDKPQQIWTQGETENNSAWFPTVDKPNERMTEEVYLTVQDRFKTLSNGILESSKKNADGTRTDHWVMDMPHAPYLVMLAIGEFAVVEEMWNGKLLQYYVEPKYKPYAKEIYTDTPDMLTFFSNYLGVPYPWQKYSQIIVRDYVSGAMENTTGVIFGDFIQKTARELIDETGNERIVAHEMMHHWFGDYVTCESWANLTMNEGFANYSEYLWFEEKYGRDMADYHLMGEQSGYLASSLNGAYPLIRFGYDDKEDMFDAHSYNKGGAVLHMLRKTVGEDAFRAGLEKYLSENKFSAVEAHNLRLAMEDVTGLDLNWFFNQWYFNAGHPQLEIQYDYDAGSGEAVVKMKQTQPTGENPAIFILPMAIDVYTAEGKTPIRKQVSMDKREQVFRIPVPTKPKLIVADADHYLLAEINEERSEEEYAFQYRNAPLFYDRYVALDKLSKVSGAEALAIREAALGDPFWVIRNQALGLVDMADNPAIVAKVADMAENDKHSQVQASALLALAGTGDKQYISAAKKAIDSKDKAYSVVAAGLEALTALDGAEAVKYAEKLERSESPGILSSIGDIYAKAGNLSKMAFFPKHLEKMTGYAGINFFSAYAELAMGGGPDKVMEAAREMEKYAKDQTQDPWRRLSATNAIDALYQFAKETKDTERVMEIKRMIGEIKTTETNDQLKGMYERYGQ